jgi:hypothetical protein
MFEHFERHKEQYDELMAELDFKDLFIYDVLMEKTWGEDGIPAQKKIPYDIHVRDVQNSYLDAFADNYIRGTAETCDVEAYITELVSIYSEALGGADGILERNTEFINDFFERVQFMYGRLKDTSIIEKKIEKKKNNNDTSKENVEKEIEKITAVEIGELKEQIEIYEGMKHRAPDGKRKPKLPRSKEVEEPGKSIWATMGRTLGDSVSAFLVTQVKEPMSWMTALVLLVSVTCYFNILGDQIPYAFMLWLFTVGLSILNVYLPYSLANHKSDSSKWLLGRDLTGSVAVAIAAFSLSVLYRGRFESGNQIIMSVGMALVPMVSGLALGFAWKSKLKKVVVAA